MKFRRLFVLFSYRLFVSSFLYQRESQILALQARLRSFLPAAGASSQSTAVAVAATVPSSSLAILAPVVSSHASPPATLQVQQQSQPQSQPPPQSRPFDTAALLEAAVSGHTNSNLSNHHTRGATPSARSEEGAQSESEEELFGRARVHEGAIELHVVHSHHKFFFFVSHISVTVSLFFRRSGALRCADHSQRYFGRARSKS